MFVKEGRFVKDVEPKMLEGRDGEYAVINTRMAFNSWARGKNQVLFADVNFIGATAEWVVRNILKDGKTGKGMMVKVGGELYELEYEKDGEKRKSLHMDVDFVKYAPMANTNTNSGTNATSRSTSGESRAAQTVAAGASASDAAPTFDPNDPFSGSFDFPELISDETA